MKYFCRQLSVTAPQLRPRGNFCLTLKGGMLAKARSTASARDISHVDRGTLLADYFENTSEDPRGGDSPATGHLGSWVNIPRESCHRRDQAGVREVTRVFQLKYRDSGYNPDCSPLYSPAPPTFERFSPTAHFTVIDSSAHYIAW